MSCQGVRDKNCSRAAPGETLFFRFKPVEGDISVAKHRF